MKTNDKWSNIIGGIDTISLVRLIWKAIYSGTATEAPTQTYIDAKMALLTFRQGRRQSNSKYIDEMKSKVEIFEQFGGEPSMSSQQVNNQIIANNIIITNPTDEDIQDAKHQTKEEFIYYLILKNCDSI